MADGTKIEWTEATWNPVTGCSVTSPGCTNCYAMKLAGTRLQHHPSRAGLTIDSKAGPVWNGKVRFNDEWLDQPLRWKRPRLIFVCAHGDLFHESVPDEWIDRVFAVMALSPQHKFQVLTKRSARMRSYFLDRVHPELRANNDRRSRIYGEIAGAGSTKLGQSPGFVAAQMDRLFKGGWPLPNVWLGVSVEDQQRADERIPDLLRTPAAVRWLSCEPLLGAVDLTRIERIPDMLDKQGRLQRCGIRIDALAGKYRESGMNYIGEWDINQPYPRTAPAISIDWIVAGGESGPGARPMHPDWARSLRDQCAAAGVPFFFKQWGQYSVGGIERSYPVEGYKPKEPLPWWPDGTRGHGDHRLNGGTGWAFTDVGKKRAGRLLDGVLHDGMPEAAHG